MESEIKQVRLAPQPNTNIMTQQKENLQETESKKITNPYISVETIFEPIDTD